jgi:hypothetical protein
MIEKQTPKRKKEIQEILKKERAEYESKRLTEIGYVNIHIDLISKEVICSTKPYKTKKEANLGFFIGQGIEKVGCFKIKYTKVESKK